MGQKIHTQNGLFKAMRESMLLWDSEKLEKTGTRKKLNNAQAKKFNAEKTNKQMVAKSGTEKTKEQGKKDKKMSDFFLAEMQP